MSFSEEVKKRDKIKIKKIQTEKVRGKNGWKRRTKRKVRSQEKEREQRQKKEAGLGMGEEEKEWKNRTKKVEQGKEKSGFCQGSNPGQVY